MDQGGSPVETRRRRHGAHQKAVRTSAAGPRALHILISTEQKLRCRDIEPLPLLLPRPPPRQQPPPRRRPDYIPDRIDAPRSVWGAVPGRHHDHREKLIIAHHLALLGVDIIEAGFPGSSPDGLDVVRSIAIKVCNTTAWEEGHVPIICGVSGCNKDIDAACEAIKHLRRPRIHTFVATSEIHMQHSLRAGGGDSHGDGGLCSQPGMS